MSNEGKSELESAPVANSTEKTATIYPAATKDIAKNPGVADANLTVDDKPTIQSINGVAPDADIKPITETPTPVTTPSPDITTPTTQSTEKVPTASPVSPVEKADSTTKPKTNNGDEEKQKHLSKKLNSIDISFGVSLAEKVFLAKHLSIILKSGISLPESLRVVADQSKGKLRKVLDDVIFKVESGKALNVAMSDHKDVFDSLFRNMIKIGEKSGSLDQSLTYLAEQLEKDSKLVGKIKSASLYPTIVLITAVGVGGGISYFILPKLTKLFTSFKAGLPLPTRMLLWFSKSIEKYGVIWLAVLIALVVGVWLLLKIKAVRGVWQRIQISLPIIGKLTIGLNLARFSLTLGTLLKSSVAIDEALSITSDALDFIPYQNAIIIMKNEVSKGKTMLEGIEVADKKRKLFDPSTRAMIRVGEKTGTLNNSLVYISKFFQDEVDNITQNLATSLEPILLIIIALVVGFIAIAIITPMYSILGVIGG